jgi:hypothetical protein
MSLYIWGSVASWINRLWLASWLEAIDQGHVIFLGLGKRKIHGFATEMVVRRCKSAINIHSFLKKKKLC